MVGHASALDTHLEAPISGRKCVYFIATVTIRGRTLFEERAGVPFLLEDGSGRAIVDPADARFALTVDFTLDQLANTDARVAALFARNGRNIILTQKAFLRYREAAIEVGEEVAVLGTGVRAHDADVPRGDAYRGDRDRSAGSRIEAMSMTKESKSSCSWSSTSS